MSRPSFDRIPFCRQRDLSALTGGQIKARSRTEFRTTHEVHLDANGTQRGVRGVFDRSHERTGRGVEAQNEPRTPARVVPSLTGGDVYAGFLTLPLLVVAAFLPVLTFLAIATLSVMLASAVTFISLDFAAFVFASVFAFTLARVSFGPAAFTFAFAGSLGALSVTRLRHMLSCDITRRFGIAR